MNTPSVSADSYLPISLATLPLTSTVGVNVYLKTRSGEPPLLFCAAHNPISRSQFEDLMSQGSSKLYIQREDSEVYQLALRENWQELLTDSSLPVLQRFVALHEIIRDVLCAEFLTSSTDSIVNSCRTYGSGAVDVLGDGALSHQDLARLLHHDSGLFTHATNASAYAILLARALGFGPAELKQIASGALLHDLGMLDIEPVLTCKTGKLSECERRHIEHHPSLGLQRVIERSDLSQGMMMMIYQHHERLNGSGYPVAISGEEIHPWSRLCSIVDVYEALTSQRPHRPSLSVQTALAVLDRGCGTEFDQEMLTCWRQLVLN